MLQKRLQKQLQIRKFHYFKPPLIHFLKKEVLEEDLKDSLLKQLVIFKFHPQEKFFLELIFDALDEEGFLTEPFSQLVKTSGLSFVRADQIRILLQNLEPEGLFRERKISKISYEKRLPECSFDGQNWYVFDVKIQGMIKIFYQRNQLLLSLTQKIYEEAFLKKNQITYIHMSKMLNIHLSTLYRLVKDKYFQILHEIYSYEEFFYSQKKKVLDREKIFLNLWSKFQPKTGTHFQKIYLQEQKTYIALRTVNKYRQKLALKKV